MAAVDAACDERRSASLGAQVNGAQPARWMELAGTIQRLAGARDLEEVVGVVRETARRLIGADGIAFILRDGDFCHYLAEDAATPLWAGRRFPLSSCASGWAMEHGRTAVIPDVYADERVRHDAYRPTFVKSMVVTPVAGGPDEAMIAAIGAYWAERRHPRADEIAILEALARSSATAIANTRLLESLRASDALQRTIVESTPECIKIVAEDGRLLQMNSAGLSMIEAADEASVRQACTYDLIAPEHRERWRQMHQRVCAGEHLDWEFDIVGLGGTRRRMETHAAPLKLPDGTVAQLAVTRDVTRRKGAEEALRLERDRSRAVLDNLGDGYVLVDQDFRVLEINPAGLAIEQRPASEIVGKSFWAAWPGVEESEAGRRWQEAMAERAPRSFEHRYVWPNGRAAWLEVRAFPADHGLAFFFRDVGERRAAEERLRELNETLESEVEARTAERNRVWEMSRDLFAIMGFDGRLKAINPAWEATLGMDMATLLSLPFPEQVHPEDHDAVRAAMEVLLRGENVPRFEDRLRHADGSWRWISWALVPEGDVFYAVGRDVTAEKEAAAELEAAQQALRQSQKMEAMGQLTGGVAHDFNNLLTPIIGSLDMLTRRGVGNERERRLIDGALQSADRAKTLVQRLLAFARRQPLQPSAVDLGALVEGMAGLIESTLGPTIDVQVVLGEELPPANADPNQLEMALLNLAVNARDAMPDGGLLIIEVKPQSVRTGHRTKLRAGHYVLLSVSDTGVGMDDQTLARAVEPFFSTKGIGKGTGLGLSMVHGLAAQLGGALTIDSTVGRGTRIDLWLPVSLAPADEEDGPAVAGMARRGRGKALLVDDEDLVRMSTADMLVDLGFEVIEAGSAEEALRLIESGERPDLLVTDHLMSGMSGAELARMLREKVSTLPVLIVSGYAEADGIAPDLPRLTKPFRNAELADRIASLNL